jgi:inner membrane protein
MPTIFTHPVVALGVAPFFRRSGITPTLLLVGVLCTVVPDLDGIGLRLGIPYESPLGHRGLSHSVFFAVAWSGLMVVLCRTFLHVACWRALFVFLLLCTASHGVLDALTDGGHGIAFLAPFSDTRYFLPWQPIAVSPLSVSRFLSGQAWPVLISEFWWVVLPFATLGIVGVFTNRRRG